MVRSELVPDDPSGKAARRGFMSDEFNKLLKELLAESPEQTARRMKDAWERATLAVAGKVVIFGAGQLGRFLLPALRSAGLEPLAFCDNNASNWGTQIEGLPVVSPAGAMDRYGDSACFVVAIYNATPACRQLQELGCQRVIRYPLLFWKYARFIPDERLATPGCILKHAEEMRPAYDLLSDEESRREFRAQIRWRCLLDYDCLPRPHPPEEMYFPPDLFRLTAEEVFVDCGAFDGDSIRTYLARAENRVGRVYAFEPDEANRRALASYVGALAPDIDAHISILPYAIGRQDGIARFNAEGSVGSKVVNSEGAVQIECRSLDSVFGGDVSPTFIKMDIEGAETDAIPGAEKIIARCHPVIAACAYHRPEHLWILPTLLKAANPEYRIYLRRYAEECWETVYYAIPPERLLGGRLTNPLQGSGARRRA
jgi:FkbM family methyltransferase